ncbi:MAG: hypothetical protein U0521_18575 [Anaerolineae bacterium]
MRKIFVLLLILLGFGLIPGSAQGDDTPFLRMLARVPDTTAAREFLTYVDYRAIIAARPGAPSVSTWQQYEATARTEAGGRLQAALMGIMSGPSYFTQSFLLGGDMAEAVGFDPFTVERGIEYGQPPATVTILEGNFDTNAVIAAHEARGYTESELGSLTLLCGADGCENGLTLNLRDRNPANPFGGSLGRSQPVLVGDGLVVSSPSIGALDLAASSINGESGSLADNADYRAAAEALSASGAVLQAYFITPSEISTASEALTNLSLSAAEIKALRAQLAKDFVPVPQYNLIVLGDTATDSEQIGTVALVYANETDAEAAAALFPAKLQNSESLQMGRAFGEVLADRGVTSIDATVYAASTGRSVMLLALHAPLPKDTTEEGRPQASSLVYSVLARAYFARDLGWLATQF